MKAIFEGRRELFAGLAIDELDYDWKIYPVIKIDMSELGSSDPEQFDFLIKRLLLNIGLDFGIGDQEISSKNVSSDLSPGTVFSELIKKLAKAYNKVVVLIDEYDKPLLNVIDDPAKVAAMKEKLSSFYGILKSADEHLRFIFITGVSRFSRTSIFSGLNNLKDLSIHDAAGSLLGYTDEEIDRYFGDYCHEMQLYFDKTRAQQTVPVRDELRTMYDGYLFHEDCPHVYNPFSVMSAFDAKKFDNYWFATGTPAFLIKKLKLLQSPFLGFDNKRYSSLELGQLEKAKQEKIGGVGACEDDNAQEEDIFFPALLFQTGYLTIADYNYSTKDYGLTIPNEEVRAALGGAFLYYFVGRPTEGMATEEARQLRKHLDNNDLLKVFAHLEQVISRIPYDLHAATEGYYATIFYLIFWFSAQRVIIEEKMAHGAIDAVVSTKTHHYVFEFKLNRSAKVALKQIEDKTYWHQPSPKASAWQVPYKLDGKKIILIGANFSSKTRALKNWVAKDLASGQLLTGSVEK